MILDNFWIIYKTNDPQIFHLQKKLWGLQIIHEARRMLFDYLVGYTLAGFISNILYNKIAKE